MQAVVKECAYEELQHPPYSYDLALCEHYVVSKLKKKLDAVIFYRKILWNQRRNPNLQGWQKNFFGGIAWLEEFSKC